MQYQERSDEKDSVVWQRGLEGDLVLNIFLKTSLKILLRN